MRRNGGRDGDPFAEPASGRRERMSVAGLDHPLDLASVQLDQQIACAAVLSGEEGAVQSQAPESHHGRPGHADLAHHLGGGVLETCSVGGLRRVGALASAHRTAPVAEGMRWSDKLSGPGSSPSASTVRQFR